MARELHTDPFLVVHNDGRRMSSILNGDNDDSLSSSPAFFVDPPPIGDSEDSDVLSGAASGDEDVDEDEDLDVRAGDDDDDLPFCDEL